MFTHKFHTLQYRKVDLFNVSLYFVKVKLVTCDKMSFKLTFLLAPVSAS